MAQYSIVQYSTVQYSIVQYSTVQYSTVQYSTVQYSIVQYSTVQYSIVQYSIVKYSIIQNGMVQYSIVQYNINQIRLADKLRDQPPTNQIWIQFFNFKNAFQNRIIARAQLEAKPKRCNLKSACNCFSNSCDVHVKPAAQVRGARCGRRVHCVPDRKKRLPTAAWWEIVFKGHAEVILLCKRAMHVPKASRIVQAKARKDVNVHDAMADGLRLGHAMQARSFQTQQQCP